MKIVRESLEFERGKDPKKAMGLGLITIDLEFQGVIYDEDKWDAGIMEFDLSDPETKETYDQLKQIGLKWKIPLPSGAYMPEIKFTGTRDQITILLTEVYLQEDFQTIKDAMNKWDGRNTDDLWDILGYL